MITSFAQQQPQVDNEMHVADQREPDKALLGMESLSMTLYQLPTQHKGCDPGCGRRSTSCPEGSWGAEPGGDSSALCPHNLPTLSCSHGPGCSSRGAQLRIPTPYFGTFHFRALQRRGGIGSPVVPVGREHLCPLVKGCGKLRHGGCQGRDAQLSPVPLHPGDHSAPTHRHGPVPLCCFT